MPRAVCLAAAAVLAAGLVGVPAARADGDPASDYLITQSVFAPYDGEIPGARAAQLRLLVNGGEGPRLPDQGRADRDPHRPRRDPRPLAQAASSTPASSARSSATGIAARC